MGDLLKEENNKNKELQDQRQELYEKGVEEGLRASKTEINKLTMKCQIYKEKAIQTHNKAKAAKDALLQWKQQYSIHSINEIDSKVEGEQGRRVEKLSSSGKDREGKSSSSTAN